MHQVYCAQTTPTKTMQPHKNPCRSLFFISFLTLCLYIVAFLLNFNYYIVICFCYFKHLTIQCIQVQQYHKLWRNPARTESIIIIINIKQLTNCRVVLLDYIRCDGLSDFMQHINRRSSETSTDFFNAVTIVIDNNALKVHILLLFIFISE